MRRFLDIRLDHELELAPLFLNRSLRGLAISFLILFSPIYIYKTVTALGGDKSVAFLGVFGFFIGHFIFKFFAMLLAEELSIRAGLKRSMYLGLLALALCLAFIFLSADYPPFLFLASPFWGISSGFYWFGWHSLLIGRGKRDSFGKEVGLANVATRILLLGSPLLGGVVIALFGYPALFLASLVLVLLSSLALVPFKGERIQYDVSLREVLRSISNNRKAFFVYWGDSLAKAIYHLAIPLYLFLIFGKELSLGGFFSLSMLLVALLNFAVGGWIDKRGKGGVVKVGAVLASFSWLGRFVARSIPLLLFLDVVDQATAGMTGIPLVTWTYEKARDGHSRGRALLFREMALVSSTVVACLLLIGLALLEIDLVYSFLAAAIFSLSPFLISSGRRSSLTKG
jgi:MFS family permease